MRQKQVVVSIDNWKTLQRLGHLGMTFDDVITELLNTKGINRSEVLQGQQVGPLGLTVPESKGELRPNG
jgi:hypothetical protein